MMEVKVTKTTNPKVKPDPATVPFGVAFTDHMFMMEYDSENGWQNPRIVPFGDISEPRRTGIPLRRRGF